MTLTLTSVDQQRLTAALRALVSVDVVQPGGWEKRVLRALKPLLRAERGAFFVALGGGLPEGVSEDYDSGTLESYRTYYAARDVGLQRLVARGLNVFSRSMLFREGLDPLLRSECYNDFLAPTRMADSVGMSLPGEGPRPAGVLAFHRSDAGSEDFAATAPALLRILYPALHAGWQVRQRLRRQVDDLGGVVDALPEAAAIYAPEGRLLHANPRLLELLSTEPHGGELRSALDSAAAARAHLLPGLAPRSGARASSRPAAGFRIRATLLESLLPHPVVLVTAEPARARVPSRSELVRRFGLTRRQAEVALLLAQRLSNREIAERLVISPHTARRHTEAVRAKLGLRDRRMVAKRLRQAD